MNSTKLLVHSLSKAQIPLRRLRNKVHGHKSRKSATQIMKVGDMICAAEFRDLGPHSLLRGLCC